MSTYIFNYFNNISNCRFFQNFSFHRNKRMTQLMAGGGVALIGGTLVPLLSGLFG